jgi:uncharacterized protein involved in exopolysaccharide biosynthesis
MTITFAALLDGLRRWWWLLLLGPLLGAAAGLGLASLQPPRFQATATVLILPTRDPGSFVSDDLVAAARLAATYGRLAGTGPVLAAAGAAVAPPLAAADLARVVSARAAPDLPIVDVTAAAGDAQRAADLANAVARALVERFRADEAARAAPVEATLAAQRSPAPAPAATPAATGADPGLAGDQAEAAALEAANALALRLAANEQAASVWAEATPPTERVAPRPLLLATLGAVVGALLAAGALVGGLLLGAARTPHPTAADAGVGVARRDR